jgi:mycothiol system anti-sigma-R factor
MSDDRMTPCSEAVERLWDYLDRALSRSDRARVDHHLAFCRRCCGELEFAKELRAFLAAHAADEVPADVKDHLERLVEDMEG